MTTLRVVPHKRVAVPFAGDEKAMLSAFLDRYRETVVWKLGGLSKQQAAQQLVPSASTLLGLVKHLAYVERWWFQMNFAGEPIPFPWPEDEPDQDIDFRVAPTDTIESISALYQQEIARSREIVTGASVDDLGKGFGDVEPRSLRWVMVHMIEETARHAGHMDILRELTDGAIGQ
jgi:uncharacterized damage-inducible protein DinB